MPLILPVLDAIGHYDTLDGKDIHERDMLELEHGGEWLPVQYGRKLPTTKARGLYPGATSSFHQLASG